MSSFFIGQFSIGDRHMHKVSRPNPGRNRLSITFCGEITATVLQEVSVVLVVVVVVVAAVMNALNRIFYSATST
jgi:hypothetical protein